MEIEGKSVLRYLSDYFISNSNLPGPRANIELEQAFSDVVEKYFGETEKPQPWDCVSKDEHALTWRANIGFRHTRVSDGESTADSHMTPILVRDGLFERDYIAAKFKRDSQDIDQEVAIFIYNKLLSFGGSEE
ncbi:hypothetical protein ES703_104681 [subsurface metagenome]